MVHLLPQRLEGKDETDRGNMRKFGSMIQVHKTGREAAGGKRTHSERCEEERKRFGDWMRTRKIP